MSNRGTLGFPLGRDLNSGLFGFPLGLRAYLAQTLFSTEGEDSANSQPPLVTAAAGANAKGVYTQLTASANFNAEGFYLIIESATVSADFLVDIAIGAAGSEEVIISNLLFCAGSDNGQVQDVFIPLPIRAGDRIAARCQSSDAAATIRIMVQLISGGFANPLEMTVATTYGADTSDSGGTVVDPGAVGNTKGAYAQIVDALTSPFEYLLICVGNRNNAVYGVVANQLIDIALGPLSGETVLLDNLFARAAVANDCFTPQIISRFARAPAGVRVAARTQSNSTDATDRLVDIVLIGFK